MPRKWLKRYRDRGELSVYNMGGAWSSAVSSAMTTFNTLGFGVKLVIAKEERSAEIVVKLSNGTEIYPYDGHTINVQFKSDTMHGKAVTLAKERKNEIYFGAVFLPGKIKNLTLKQKQVIVVHELIHVCGLDGSLADGTGEDPNMNHDTVGVMAGQMMISGDGLIEYLHEKNTPPMTPIRVGGRTMCQMRMLWANEACERD